MHAINKRKDMTAEEKRTEIINKMLVTPAITTENRAAIPEPVAVIGLAGSFPGSKNVHAFLEALDNDRSLIEEIPASRINWHNLYDPEGKDPKKSRTKWGGIMPDIQNFDPEFFGILPGEAKLMDPRKRLLLMSVYQAIEDAGYAPRSFRNSKTGVFVAVEEDEYGKCMRDAGIDENATAQNADSLIANQISYFLDLRGPSEVINTMCSGAAVAIHRAVGALRTGEISVAIVGAANLLLHSDPFVFLSRTGQMSPTDSVHSFGKNANGFLRAEGVASIILKPLSKAVEDKDAIYAVIKHTAVNYNGKGGMSMAAPNISSHAQLIETCYEEAGIDPRRLNYIEAQGMGNQVADIAEWEACNKALKAIASKKDITLQNGNCRISTLKPMTGHMHAASALGALFKIIRSFHTNKIHKILGFTEVNPDLDMEDQPCRLAIETEDWQQQAFPRLAGLHAYGAGGNNAHIVIEEYKEPVSETGYIVYPEKVVIPCSAETEEQCKRIVQNLLETVQHHPDYWLASIAYTMQTGRDAMKHRVAFIAGTREEFIQQATAWVNGFNGE